MWGAAARPFSPDVVARAACALDLVLAGVRRSTWPEVAWRFSHLTGDGYPLELAFTTYDRSLRYTAEVAGPEVDPVRRLAIALDLLPRLGAPPVPPHLLAGFEALQAGGALRYGAWLGGRHAPPGAARDSYKLYVEVPPHAPQAAAFVAGWLGDVSNLAGRHLTLRMLGCDLRTGYLELYLRIDRLARWEIERLLHCLGLGGQSAPLLELLEAAFGRPLPGDLPTANVGLSFVVDGAARSAGPLPVFSLFFGTRAVFGADGVARRRLLTLAAERGWSLPGYAEISAPLAAGAGPHMLHGLVAFSVGHAGPPALGIGLSPPVKPFL